MSIVLSIISNLLSWCILISHPLDFTPVCTTELAKAAQLAPEFHKRGVKMIALSCNESETHNAWIKDIKAYGELEGEFPYSIIDDSSREISSKLGYLKYIYLNSLFFILTFFLKGMLDTITRDNAGMPVSVRAVRKFYNSFKLY